MMKSMGRTKVIIAITKSNFGGAQRYVYDLATTLPHDRYDVTIVCGGNGPLVEMLTEAGVRVIPLPGLERDVKMIGDIKAFRTLLQILRSEKPDVLHLNSSKMGGIGVLAGRIAHIPRIIFTAHGWEFNAPRPLWQRVIIHIFSTLIVILAHRTIAVSERLKRDMRILHKKITVIHNGIAPVHKLDSDEARRGLVERAETLPDVHGLWLGTIAELHPVKGLDTAIAAFATIAQEIPTAQYIIIGEGHERARIAALIRKHALERRVHLIGFVPRAARYLRAFDVFVLPSRSEGLAYVILEAGLASLPVIASRVGGIPEIIESDAYGTLVPRDDADALAQAMRTLAGDAGLRSRLGTALHDRVAEQFSLDKMVRMTSAEYDSR